MNKIFIWTSSRYILACGSCKPKQSAYKAAYEPAKAKESTSPVEAVKMRKNMPLLCTNQVQQMKPVRKRLLLFREKMHQD